MLVTRPPWSLVPVADGAAERAMLEDLRPDETRVPILNTDGRLDRVRSLLAYHQVDYQLDGDPVVRQSPSRPRRVICLGTVEDAFCVLARHLFQAKDGAENEPGDALVLLDLDTQEAGDTLLRLKQLHARGWTAGVVPFHRDTDWRWLLLKMLLVERVRVTPERCLFWGGAEEPGAPPILARVDAMPRIEDVEFFSFSGHANAFDMRLGSRILCSLDRDRGAASQAFPCWSRGFCFRLHKQISPGDWPEQLVHVSSLRASLVVLSGCNVFPPGRAARHPDAGIVAMLLDGLCLGLAVSAGLQPLGLRFELLWLALLGEGATLGEAWREMVTMQREMITILLGSPCLRVDGLDAAAPQSPVFNQHLGQVIRSRAPASGLAPEVEGEGAWWSALRMPGNEVLLWWNGRGKSPRVVWREPAEFDESLRGLVKRAGSVRFWSDYVEAWLGPRGPCANSEASRTWRERLHEAQHLIRRVHRHLAGSPLVPRDAESSRRVLSALNTQLEKLWDDLFSLALECASYEDPLTFQGTAEVYAPRSTSTEAGKCACGHEWLRQRVWRTAAGGPKRVVYDCPRCGLTGEDDGSRQLRIVRTPAAAAEGRPLSLGLEARAKDAAILRYAMILDSLAPVSRLIGEKQRKALQPNRTEHLEAVLDLPADLGPGLRMVGVMALLDGTLIICRQVVSVTQEGDPRSSGDLDGKCSEASSS